MNQTTIAILGTDGMLGSMVLDVLSQEADYRIIASMLSAEMAEQARSRKPDIDLHVFNVMETTEAQLAEVLDGASLVINNIGIIKPYIRDDNPDEVEVATRVNVLFPLQLGRAAASVGARVIQIATDCVYSGMKGSYVEQDPYDSLDVYGKTKSLGEVFLENVHHLRCSIVGPEPKAYLSLMEWFLQQPQGSTVNGYTNHEWNGITTLHFARICCGVIKKDMELPHLQHIIPANRVTKEELLHYFAREYGRQDITIHPVEAETVIDRTLATNNDSINRALWQAAGYKDPPDVPQMVAELAQFDYSWNGSEN